MASEGLIRASAEQRHTDAESGDGLVLQMVGKVAVEGPALEEIPEQLRDVQLVAGERTRTGAFQAAIRAIEVIVNSHCLVGSGDFSRIST